MTMTITAEDKVLMKLTMFREDSGGGLDGMRAVGHVIYNRALKRKQSIYKVCTQPWQFSSINCPGGGKEQTGIPPLVTAEEVTRLKLRLNDYLMFRNILSDWPQEGTSDWTLYQSLEKVVLDITSDVDLDITNGATMYYASSMTKPPKWDFTKLVFTGEIGEQKYYREIV